MKDTRWIILVRELKDEVRPTIEDALTAHNPDTPEPDLVAVIVGGEPPVMNDAGDALAVVGELAKGEELTTAYVDLWLDRRVADDS